MKHLMVLSAVLALSLFSVAQRLPEQAVPQHYTLKLTPDMQAAKFAGEETIDVRVLKPTPSITLNAVDISFNDVSITSGGASQKATVKLDTAGEMATLTVPKALPAGPAQISIRYTGVLNDKLRGFYLAKDKDRRYAVTQFEATDARRAFPGFDEPAYKATFDISVVAPVSNTAISNSKIVADTPGPGPNQHTVRFGTSPKMSTYLVAVLVGEFQCIEGSADNIPIRVCTPPGQQEMGRFALTASESILKYYDQYFGIKYPYGKLDHIAIPDFEAGAMENVGAITYRDIALLVDEQHASIDAKKQVASVIAHEMAHQWFGDLVTMKWWNDIWLNEGFATWMAFKPVEAWKPEWHHDLDEQLSANDAMASDSLHNTRPIRQPAQTSAQINELFDAIAYNKTAAVLRMVESYVGADVFRQGINNYLQAHSNANATAEDFWTSIAAAAHKPADRIISSFVNLPGVPIVSATLNCGGDASTVTLTQQRFFLDHQLAGAAKDSWVIPVCLSQGSGGSPECELLTEPQQTFPLKSCSTSTFINAGARGYYRSNYDRQAISEFAPKVEKQLTPVERLALLDNEWALVRSGTHRIDAFMNLAEGVQGDNTEAVAFEVNRRLAFISDYLVSAQDRDPYESWVRNTLRPKMQELGWTAAPNDSDERRTLRATVFQALGYSGRDPEALQQAKTLLQSYFQNPGSVDPSMLNTVFALAALQGTPALYDQFEKRSGTATNPEDHYRYLLSLARFTDPALLQRTLDLSLSPQVRSQNTVFLIGAVMRNPAGRDLAWQFVRTHWGDIQKKASLYGAAVLVRFTGTFCDATAAQQVQQFFAQHPVPSAERSLKQSLEQINDCAQVRSQQQPSLAQWLSSQHRLASRR